MALSLQHYAHSYSRSGLNRIMEERLKEEQEIKIGHLFREDLVIEILSWMPVKDLLQFKTVCKSWYAIISSPNFISKHLKNHCNNNDSWPGCLLANFTLTNFENQLYAFFVDETPRVLAELYLYCDYQCIDGPCDGIYYLHGYLGRALWNPTLNELRVLPHLSTESNPYQVHGFGVDPQTQDYKVVVIEPYMTDEGEGDINCPLSLFVYSLRTNSWSHWGDLAKYYYLYSNQCYICVNACFYWLGSFKCYQNSPDIIISFDLTIDAYKEINLPNYEESTSTWLGICDEALAFCTFHTIEKRLDVWMLNEGIWSKKFTMGSLSGVWSPLGYWKNNKLVLEGNNCNLLLCDLKTHVITNLECKRGYPYHRCLGVYAHMESLVSIKDKNRWAVDVVDEEAERSRDEHAAYLAKEWEKKREKEREICHEMDEIVEDIQSFLFHDI